MSVVSESMNSKVNHIIEQFAGIQNGKPWIGSTYESKLKEIDEDSAFERPREDLHSVAEILSHLTFWREEAILKIKTGSGSKTDDCKENWLPVETLKAKGWARIRSEHEKSLSELLELLSDKNDDFLDQDYYDTDFKGRFNYSFLINGMLHHDLYHLGQLGIIIRQLSRKDTKKSPSQKK